MSVAPKQAFARQRRSGVGWFLDWIGDVQVVYMDGRVTDASYDEYVAAMARDIDARADDDRISVLYDVPEPAAFSARRRKQLGDVLKAREERLRHLTIAYAMVTPSFVVRGGLKMLFWLAPPPYPTTVTASPLEALEFIARHQSGIDPEAWLKEHERLCAAFGKP